MADRLFLFEYNKCDFYSVTEAFSNFVKALNKHDVTVTIPSAGDNFSIGSATCDILAANTDSSDPNNTSIVLRIKYGDTSFLFTGDAERS